MQLPDSYLQKFSAVPEYFNAIHNAQPPERFTYKFMENLGFTSTNDRLFIGVLKSLGFLDADSRQFARYMLANAFEVSIDSHGRVLIPESLAKFASLNDEVILAGLYSRIEIWDKSTYDKLMSNTSKNADDMALRIAKLGIE